MCQITFIFIYFFKNVYTYLNFRLNLRACWHFRDNFRVFLFGDYPFSEFLWVAAAAASWVHGHCGLSPWLCCSFLQFVLPCERWEREEFIFILNDINVAEDWTLITVCRWKGKPRSMIPDVNTVCVSATKTWKNGSAILPAGGTGHWRVCTFFLFNFFLASS